jgi:hypothetical protein
MIDTITVEQLEQIYITLADIARIYGYDPIVKQDVTTPNKIYLCLGRDYDESDMWTDIEDKIHTIEIIHDVIIDVCANVEGIDIQIIYR